MLTFKSYEKEETKLGTIYRILLDVPQPQEKFMLLVDQKLQIDDTVGTVKFIEAFVVPPEFEQEKIGIIFYESN